MRWNNYCDFLVILLSFVIITACSKEDANNGENVIEPGINTPPLAMAVSVLDIRYNRATVSWEQAIDADDDTLHYSLFLGDSLISSNINTAYLYNFVNLLPATSYHGTVLVSDSINDPVIVNFNFTTPKYITTFSKVYHNDICTPGAGTSIEQTSDKGYIIAGVIACETLYTYLLKIDSLGYEQWNKTFDITGSTLRYRAIEALNGDFILVSNKSIVRTDPIGNTMWQFNDVGDFLDYFDIIETSDQELFAVGISAGQAIMTKLSKSGALLWKKSISDESFIFHLSMCETGDGNFAILGSIQKDLVSSFGILKIDHEGELIWEKVFETPDSDYAYSIKLTMDNGFILSGFTLKYFDVATIIKTNSEGDMEWLNTISNDALNTHAFDITQTKQGDYVFCGSTEYYKERTILQKLDANGSFLWEVIYKPENQMDYIWVPRDIKQTLDNGFVLTGIKNFIWNGNYEENGLWVLKTDPLGRL
nr:hypothetical protein [Bacteroidota bacterium]